MFVMKTTIFSVIATALSCLLLGAHFLRDGALVAAFLCAVAPIALISRRRAVLLILQIGLLAGALVWAHTGAELVEVRRMLGQPFGRLVAIIGGVIAWTAGSSALLSLPRVKVRWSRDAKTAARSAWAFWLTFASLAALQVAISPPMLLPERFLSGAGWAAVAGLSAYAAWLVAAMSDPGRQPRLRLFVWGLFSAVFFGQLLLGLLVDGRFLMTGELHLPVPALIVAGPIYRGEGLFMPILLGVTLLLVGPAWCSHLCYIGAWDAVAASKRKTVGRLPRRASWVRVGILAAAVITAAVLSVAGVPGSAAAVIAAAFGLVGVAVMLTWSRRRGTMVHCTVYCPIGLVANVFGKLSPFRIRVDTQSCTRCLACTKACRYDALRAEHVQEGLPGLTCTLCGDCVGACKRSDISYRLLGLSPPRARTTFLVLIVSLHALFLGVARL